jgi:adenylate cyclase
MGLLKKSIGLKIFSVVLAIIIIMVGVSIVNVRMERRVGQALYRVSNRYLIAYGALSRANLRSVEQAVNTRGFLIAKMLDKPEDILKAAAEQIKLKGQQFWEETALFHEMIGLELKEKDHPVDVTTLARLDEQVKGIEASQKFFEGELQNLIVEINNGSLNKVTDNFARLDKWRQDFNENLDVTRRLMLATTQNASAEVLSLQERLNLISIVLVALATILAIAFAAYITRNIVRPVRALLNGTNSVIDGRLEISLPITSTDEIGTLTEAFNSMTGELRKANTVRDMFGKYIDPRIVRDLIEKTQLNFNNGERQVMTIMFCDMAGFTNISEGLTPGSLVNLLNRYFTLMSEAVQEYDGVIDKFIGDAIMAYWGMPFNRESRQAMLAAQAALEMYPKINKFREELPELLGIRRNLPEISIRIGIATGEVVVGNIGSDKTKNFTVIGDTVNLASRLEGVNKAYGTNIMINEETFDLLNENIVTREIDSILVSGKNEPKRVFEILGMEGMLTPDIMDLKEKFAEGLAAYRRLDLDTARKAFNACREIVPEDKPTEVFLKRLDYFRENPPESSWNGVWIFTQK